MHIYCFTLREQNHVLSARQRRLVAYKIPQIRLCPGQPRTLLGSLQAPQTPSPSAGEGTTSALVCAEKCPGMGSDGSPSGVTPEAESLEWWG